MKNEYNTTVFCNGEVVQWRLRDGCSNRFKCCLTKQQKEKVLDDGVVADYDDCQGNDFATIMRLVSMMS